MGLPEYDPVRLTIEGDDGLDGTQAGAELLDGDTAGLWMAGKVSIDTQRRGRGGGGGEAYGGSGELESAAPCHSVQLLVRRGLLTLEHAWYVRRIFTYLSPVLV